VNVLGAGTWRPALSDHTLACHRPEASRRTDPN